MLNFYAVEIEYCRDTAWTYCEARHPQEAASTITERLGSDFLIRQVKLAQPIVLAMENRDMKNTAQTENSLVNKPARPLPLKHPRSKTVVTPDAEYPSVKEAQKHIQGGVKRLRKLFREQPDKYYIK